MRHDGTRAAILDVAQRCIQVNGFNGFSYANIAADVGVKTASIHYYFPTKTDLGQAIAARYREGLRTELGAINDRLAITGDSAASRLKLYFNVFRNALLDGKGLCLCVMLGAEYQSLGDAVRVEVAGFVNDNIKWLTELLAAGRVAGKLVFEGPAESEAELVLAIVEGAELVARSGGGNFSQFDRIVESYTRKIVVALK